jgi:hypothetical protein
MLVYETSQKGQYSWKMMANKPVWDIPSLMLREFPGQDRGREHQDRAGRFPELRCSGGSRKTKTSRVHRQSKKEEKAEQRRVWRWEDIWALSWTVICMCIEEKCWQQVRNLNYRRLEVVPNPASQTETP